MMAAAMFMKKSVFKKLYLEAVVKLHGGSKGRFSAPKSFVTASLILFLSLCSSGCFGTMSNMSLEDKAGQVLMVHFRGEIANEDARVLVQEVKVGGFVYYNWANGLHSPEQVRTLTSSLQELAEINCIPIPLFIALDQEGGRVAQLRCGFTQFPGNQALGEMEDLNLAEAQAFVTGQELRAVGVNMNLAPVVDVNCNPRNPVIGSRSFGADPNRVAAFGEKALAGYKSSGIIATLKHFPGHGDVEVDSHEDLPVVPKSIEILEQVELLPFIKLAPFADAIMTAHLLVPALDADRCSTISKKTLDYLKETIGFQGLIISDSLVMGGVLKQCLTVDEAAIEALNAGCDLLILGGKLIAGERAGFELTTADMQRIHRSIVKAVKEGRLSQSRLDQAVEKNLSLKKRRLALKVS